MLATFTDLKVFYADGADFTDGANWQAALQGADAAVKQYCKRQFEQAAYVEYYDGQGTPYLPLRQRPVGAVSAVYLDAMGFYGDGANAFPTNSLLVSGKDYILRRDGTNGASESGLLQRLGGGWTGAILDWPAEWRRGTLTARVPPVWSIGSGNVKVLYTAGYQTIPDDLKLATLQLAIQVYKFRKRGGLLLQHERLGDYDYQLLALAPDLGTTRQLLSRYREVAI